jgi:ERCC4-type nuclease
MIIIDTREQHPLLFAGRETIRRKLSEGDYNIEELIPYIVLERKTLNDFYGSIITGHKRFKDEIIRSRIQGKTFYIFLEGTIKEFISLKWSRRKLSIQCDILAKIIYTMQLRHGIIIIECVDRADMEEKIISTIEICKKNYGV